MNAHDRRVDHLHLTVVGFHDGVHEADVDRRIGPVVFWHVAPRRPGAQNVEHPIEDLPVGMRLRPSPIHWNQRLENAPLEVREIVASHDPSSDVRKRESLFDSGV